MSYAPIRGSMAITVGSQFQGNPRLNGSTLMEFVHVETATIAFFVQASRAGTEFPDDFQKQLRYSHLDWIVLDAKNRDSFTGILPQLWGLQPMTVEVAAMLTAPSMKAGAEVCTEQLP